jgi:hypothetical protein
MLGHRFHPVAALAYEFAGTRVSAFCEAPFEPVAISIPAFPHLVTFALWQRYFLVMMCENIV